MNMAFFIFFFFASVISSAVTTVHVIQTCHLDVGFALTAAGELNNYHKYLLEAAAIAKDLRDNPAGHGEALIFTTHPYIVSLLLNCSPGMGFSCPTSDEQATIRAAIKGGDIVMQAFPFNAETATYFPDSFKAAFNLTSRLAADLGVPAPTVMTQRDVPGATRGMVPLLVQHGVTGFSVGVNTASLPPATPRVFVWRDEASNTEVLTSLHPHGYGGIELKDCIVIDGFEHALCPDYKGDNQGPWSRSSIISHWQTLSKTFPNAKIQSSSFDNFFALLATVKAQLPVVSQEIGDTWIFGVPSDPLKAAQWREMQRAFQVWCALPSTGHACWDGSDASVLNFTRLSTKNSEHTWGADVKTYLHDTTNWLNPEFHRLQFTAANYLFLAQSWQEQRRWGIAYARQALGPHHPLGHDIDKRLALLAPPYSPPPLAGYRAVEDPHERFTCKGFQLGFDWERGGLNYLQHTATGRVWADGTNASALGVFSYQQHSTAQYNAFFDQYAQKVDGKIPDYFPKDFGKPGAYNLSQMANSSSTEAPIKSLYFHEGRCAFAFQSVLPASMAADYGSPRQAWTAVAVTGPAAVSVELLLFNKTATRLPESMWSSFVPAGACEWRMDKLGSSIDPLDVVVNGSSHLHAVGTGVTCTRPADSAAAAAAAPASMRVLSWDAPVVSFGGANPFPTPRSAPDTSQGVSFALFNNIWGYVHYVTHTHTHTLAPSVQDQLHHVVPVCAFGERPQVQVPSRVFVEAVKKF
mmetsp:Transcript_22686/g.44914  ORF Transcript_22686/g.44914 Transcript_22686/m.44914 type:complete len:749 (-) Transcript_22686:322-2568(-)